MKYQELFNLLDEQHNITPTESEMNDIINVCREIIAKENEVPESIYQVGDTVYHFCFGLGTITSIENEEGVTYPIYVKFDNSKERFTIEGKTYNTDKRPILSFTPYDLVNGGFSQERPKTEPKVGDWGYFWDIECGVCDFDCIDAILNNTEYKYSTKRSEEYKYFSSNIPEHIKKQMK